MKKLISFMLASVILASSAVAEEDDDATLWGSNIIESDAYVQAYNTSTSQTYYMTIYSNTSNYINLPAGNYNIYVYMSEYAYMWVGKGPSGDPCYCPPYSNSYTFYGMQIDTSPSTAVSVNYQGPGNNSGCSGSYVPSCVYI